MYIDGGEIWRRIVLDNYSLPKVLPAQQSEFCFQLAPFRLWVSVIFLRGKHSALCPLASTVTQGSQLKCSCYPLRQWCNMMPLLVPVLAASRSPLEAACVIEGGSSKENETAADWHTLLIFPKANCRNSSTCKSPVSVETLKTRKDTLVEYNQKNVFVALVDIL